MQSNGVNLKVEYETIRQRRAIIDGVDVVNFSGFRRNGSEFFLFGRRKKESLIGELSQISFGTKCQMMSTTDGILGSLAQPLLAPKGLIAFLILDKVYDVYGNFFF